MLPLRVSLLAFLFLAACDRGRPAASAVPESSAVPDSSATAPPAAGITNTTSPPDGAAADNGEAGDHLLLAIPRVGDLAAGLDVIAVVKPCGELRHPWLPSGGTPPHPTTWRWLQPGQTYAVLRGGRPAGRIVVTSGPDRCAGGAGRISGIPTSPRFAALATDLEIPAGPLLHRPATPAERRAMTGLLRDSAAAHGHRVWDDELTVEVDAVPLPGGGVTLVGSVFERNRDVIQDPWWSVFLVAEREGAGYRPSIGWIEETEADRDVYAASLLDAIDLDRDGTPEIVTRGNASFGQRYSILRHVQDGWVIAFKAGGC